MRIGFAICVGKWQLLRSRADPSTSPIHDDDDRDDDDDNDDYKDDDIYIMVKRLYVTFLLILPSPKVFTPDDPP